MNLDQQKMRPNQEPHRKMLLPIVATQLLTLTQDKFKRENIFHQEFSLCSVNMYSWSQHNYTIFFDFCQYKNGANSALFNKIATATKNAPRRTHEKVLSDCCHTN